jgi:hypothetical protein
MNIAEQMPEPERSHEDLHEEVLRDIAAAKRQNAFKFLRGITKGLKDENKILKAEKAVLETENTTLKSELQEFAALYALSENNLKMALANLNLHRARQHGHHH